MFDVSKDLNKDHSIMNYVSVSPRKSNVGIKNVPKTPENILNMVKVNVSFLTPCALHDFIVLGLYNALYTGFV